MILNDNKLEKDKIEIKCFLKSPSLASFIVKIRKM